MLSRAASALCLSLLFAASAAAQPQAETKTPPTAAQAPAAEEDPVVARVNGAEIRRSEVMTQIARLPAQARNTPPEQLVPMMVEAVINTRLVQSAADKANLDNDPDVKERVEQARRDIVRGVYLERLVAKEMNDARLHARYTADLKAMPPHEEVNARHILVKTEEEAKAIVTQLDKGADFAKLAAEKSTDPAGKDSGGDLGWFTKEQMVPEFANAAFALKKGEITKTPIKTRFGWHVIKLIDRREAPAPTFEEVKNQLEGQVQNEIIADKVKELRAAAKIEILGPDGKPLPTTEAPPALMPAPTQAKPQPAPPPKK